MNIVLSKILALDKMCYSISIWYGLTSCTVAHIIRCENALICDVPAICDLQYPTLCCNLPECHPKGPRYHSIHNPLQGIYVADMG